MANLNTDLIRDEVTTAFHQCWQAGHLTDQEYKNVMDDFEYYFNQMMNCVQERPVVDDEATEFERMGGEYPRMGWR